VPTPRPLANPSNRWAPAVLRAAPWALAAGFAAAWSRGVLLRQREPAGPPAPTQPGLSRQEVVEPERYDEEEPGRGRLAAAPHHIPWQGWKDILWRTWREVGRDRLTVVAGGITYFTLLAIFPALAAFVSIYGLIADVSAVRDQLQQLAQVFPASAVDLMGQQMMRLATERNSSLSVAALISVLLSVWSANAGMKTLFDGLNVAYEETEKRNFFIRSALTYGFTLALLLFLVVVAAILVAAPIVLDALSLRTDILIGARWIVLFAVAVAAFAIAYRFGPCRRRPRWRWVFWGAVFAAFAWLAGSAGFSWYLNNIVRLQVTYGSLGAVIGFMLWVWFSVLMVLIGAELNAEIEHQTALDSTVGPPKPIGRRGAVMADTVGLRFVGLRRGARMIRDMLRRQWKGLTGRFS
jgi:membrane protein